MTILVVVESKAKVPKIQSILGKDYTVLPCFGHLQNVTNNLKWIDAHASSGWNPDTIPYSLIPGKTKALSELRAAASKASKVIIASDMDREGEAIGYHLQDLLKLKAKKIPTERIVFDQITPEAIRSAVHHPTTLREPLYRAQQARRVIDLIFGYKISPLLWSIAHKLSAGRCQSPVLRWLWERQLEFLNTDEVCSKHNISAELVAQSSHTSAKSSGGLISDGSQFQGKYQMREKQSDNIDPNAEKQVLKELAKYPKWKIVDTKASQPHQSPPIPFTTSALQQKAYSRWKWSPKTTMYVAQKLYEGGHITYMRTDCKVLAASFVTKANAYLLKRFGPEYVKSNANTSSKKHPSTKGKQAHAQEAHEPIRPVKADHPCLGGEPI